MPTTNWAHSVKAHYYQALSDLSLIWDRTVSISPERVLESLNAEDLSDILTGQMDPRVIALMAEGLIARGRA
jgi:hypothetical protein